MFEPDEFDLRLLAAIQRDGALTHSELGAIAHLSGSQCSRRLQRLLSSGVIDHYAAILSARALGLGVTAYVLVSLRSHSDADIKAFKDRILTIPEVLECAKITGAADYMLKVVTIDLEHYDRLLTENFLKRGDVSSVRSNIVLDQVKMTTALPLPTGRADSRTART
ncbi:MAG: Lrp/AsnC family transcriptional regulator [Caulobacteraceae bacterium]